ncbi:MAG: hypothetical protein ABJC74_04950 [Gemmatimonadota bacterium]
MLLLAPLYFYLATAVSALVVGLHCIVARQPASSPLPTVRFVPRGSVRITRLARPEDLLLLLVRVAAILLTGLAFARPIVAPARRPLIRIVLLDQSAAVRDLADSRDSARAHLRDGDRLIPFDTAARIIQQSVIDSIASVQSRGLPARLSPALIQALRAGSALRLRADSLELVIISPLAASAVDGATESIRALWPGRIRLVTVAAAADSGGQFTVAVEAAEDDGVLLAVSLAGLRGTGGAVRVIRRPMTPADSSWAVSGRHALVRWGERPQGNWLARAVPDSAGAVIAGGQALVYPMSRKWQAAPAPGDRVVARWVDGEPAALEHNAGAGCIRDVAIPVPQAGDIALRLPFRHLVTALVSPCQIHGSARPLGSELRSRLQGSGPLAVGHAFAPPEQQATPLVKWLLIAVFGLLLLELRLRGGGGADATDQWSEAGGFSR